MMMVQEKHHVLINNKTMKITRNTILIIISLLFINIACSQESQLTQVKTSDLSIVNSTNNQISFFGTKDELIQNFGQPILKKVMTGTDMIDYECENYAYDGINFSIENRPSNEMSIGFDITNSNYYIKYNNTTIKINDNIDGFISLFPESFNFMNNDEKKSWLRIEFHPLDSTFIPYACQLIISFDANSKLINMIEVYNY